MDKHDAATKALAAVRELAASKCNCPYESEQELANEVQRLRTELDTEIVIRSTLVECLHDVASFAGHGDKLVHQIGYMAAKTLEDLDV
jgi:hypothetical protein